MLMNRMTPHGPWKPFVHPGLLNPSNYIPEREFNEDDVYIHLLNKYTNPMDNDPGWFKYYNRHNLALPSRIEDMRLPLQFVKAIPNMSFTKGKLLVHANPVKRKIGPRGLNRKALTKEQKQELLAKYGQLRQDVVRPGARRRISGNGGIMDGCLVYRSDLQPYRMEIRLS